jgi:hypothetical protein
MAEYKINRLDAIFDHQGSPFESALARSQGRPAESSLGTFVNGARPGAATTRRARMVSLSQCAFELTIHAAHPIDVQRLHLDLFALTKPLGVVAKGFDGHRLRGGSRYTPVLEKSLERVDS